MKWPARVSAGAARPAICTARYAAAIGGAAESRILGTALRAPAPYAALANGSAGHGEEVDGAHVVGGHPGATVVPAAMAMAERQDATGADLINAVVLGYDVGTRIVAACGGVFLAKQRHHLHSDFLYAVGAAAAAGRLMALDPAAALPCHGPRHVSGQRVVRAVPGAATHQQVLFGRPIRIRRRECCAHGGGWDGGLGRHPGSLSRVARCMGRGERQGDS